MHDLKLRSNGKYHVVGMPDGSASSRCDGMAVTRWVEDAALAGQSGLIFLQTTDHFPSVRSTSRSVRFDELPARAELGDADRAWELFTMLNPFRHVDSAAKIRTYMIEPYVVAGDVYAFAPHAGCGGWAWYTGAAGWMYQLLVESLLGLKRRGDRLRVEPLLPRDWPGFDINYRFGGTRYEILCRASEDPAKGLFTLDGVKVSDSSLQLIDDGKHHRVLVHVQRRAISAAV